jgi:hypothetical protein
VKNHLFYIYGASWIILLIFIGHASDDLLLSLLRFFKLMGIPYIRTYILLLSIILLIASVLLIISNKPQRIDKKLMLRLLIGSVFGAIGSVWLLMVFMSHAF